MTLSEEDQRDLEELLYSRNDRDRAFAKVISDLARHHLNCVPRLPDSKRPYTRLELDVRRMIFFASNGAHITALETAIKAGIPEDELCPIYALLFA